MAKREWARRAGATIAAYNQRGKAEQYIKEGKNAIKDVQKADDINRRYENALKKGLFLSE